MGRRARLLLAAMVAVTMCLLGVPAITTGLLAPGAFAAASARAVDCPAIEPPLPSPTGLPAGYDAPRTPYPWAGRSQSCPVTLPSARTGARLFGRLFFPPHIERTGRRLPGVVIGPGSGQGVQANYQWLARYLAANGYVALTVDPQGVGRSETTALEGAGRLGLSQIPYQQLGNYIDALRSGLNYLSSPANPVRRWTRNHGFGLAGHSMSARAASTLQATDLRVQAIVAMDNVSSNREGDKGIMSGGGVTGALAGGEVSLTTTPNPPRVPALGLASDQSPYLEPLNTDPELKKTGYLHWRAGGTPSMEIVFGDSEHSDFARKPGDRIPLQELSAHYARAWFDRYLRGHASPHALLTGTVAGRQRADFLSPTFQSAAFLPAQNIDCPNLLDLPCTVR